MARVGGGESDTGFRLTPTWVITIVFCGLAIYLVVNYGERVTEVDVSQGKVSFQAGSLGAPHTQGKLEELAERAKQGEAPVAPPPSSDRKLTELERRIAEQVERQRHGDPSRPTDISGNWRDRTTGAAYQFWRAGDQYFFTETSIVYGTPVSTAAGRGNLESGTLKFIYNSPIAGAGAGALELTLDGSLKGMASNLLTGAIVNMHLVR